MRTVWLTLLLVGLWTESASAQAAPRIIVFPPAGEVTGPLRKAPPAVSSAIVEAARATGARVEVAAGSIDDAVTLAGCAVKQPDCLGKVASTLDADMVVGISVGAADSGLFVDVAIGKRDEGEPLTANWILDGASVEAIRAAAAREATILFSGDAPAEPAGPEPQPEPEAPPTVREVPPGLRPAPARQTTSGLGRVRWYAWATAGAGVALMATGGVFLAGARGKQDDIDSASPSSLADFRALESLEDDAASQATWGSVLFGAGVVAAGVGAALILVQMRASPDETGDTVSLAPAAFDHGAGVSLTVLGDL